MPPESTAPVDPADTKASTLPSRSLSMPSTMALCFFLRTAMTGASQLVMTSGQSVRTRRVRSAGSAP